MNLNNESNSLTKTNFSIEHILNYAGNSKSKNCDDNQTENVNKKRFPATVLPWLSCTRYCPPRIPRMYRENILKKRRVGRQARIPFTSEQLNVLEEKFKKTSYLNAAEVKQISTTLRIGENRVKIWFQNRRARERRDNSGNLNLQNNDSSNSSGFEINQSEDTSTPIKNLHLAEISKTNLCKSIVKQNTFENVIPPYQHHHCYPSINHFIYHQ